jgi:hypothetical protein
VPRYYFHVRNDIDADDDEGVELADDAAARAYARNAARHLICHGIHEHGGVNLDHHIDVAGEEGIPLFQVPFRECFTITGAIQTNK